MSNLQPISELDYDDNDQREGMEVIQLVGLKLGEEEYAIDVLKIQEIIRTVEITSVPRTDGFVLGVMNLRGKVIPVIDLRIRFSLDKMDFDKETRIIVVRFETENIGFVVDEVTEVIRINKSMVEPTPPLVGSVGQEYILGICKYQDRLIILLDIDSVVNEDKTIESDLKKTILGQMALPSAEQNYQEVASSVEQEYAQVNEEPAAIEAAEEESEESVFEEGSADDDAGASIDDLIALELAKREAETDELNKKKQEEEAEEEPKKSENVDSDLDDILNDALNQSGSQMESEDGHVEQNELDDLISLELAKREAETEELNKKEIAEIKEAPEPEPQPTQDEPEITEEELLKEEITETEDDIDALLDEDAPDELTDSLAEETEDDIDALLDDSESKDIAEELTDSLDNEIEDDIDALMEEATPEDIPEEIDAELDIDEISDEIDDVELPEETEPDISELTDEIEDIELPEEIESVDLTDELEVSNEDETELPEDISDLLSESELTSEDEQELDESLILPETEAEEEKIDPELMHELDSEEAQPEDDDDPMASLKDISAETAGSETESFDKLKTLSKKIIDGESIDIGVNIKSEIKELLDLISETKRRVDEIGPSLATSNEHIPNVLSTLESVTETTEDATLSLMENADGLNNYYQEFIEEINDLEDLIYKKDQAAILKKIVKLESDLDQADNMGFNILHALEFQDITEQKLHKVIDAVRDIGGRLGALLGFIKLKSEQDPTIVDDASQDDIDKLLADFGLD